MTIIMTFLCCAFVLGGAGVCLYLSMKNQHDEDDD